MTKGLKEGVWPDPDLLEGKGIRWLFTRRGR